MQTKRSFLTCLAFLLVAASTFAADREPNAMPRIDPQGIPGKLVICGGGMISDKVLERFVKLAGGQQGKLVVIPTASASATNATPEQFLEPWKKFSLAAVSILHAKSREEADGPEFLLPLKEATGVWFSGGQQSRIADRYVGTGVERELTALIARGGVIGGTSAGAAIMSRRMIAGGNPEPRMATGFDLLPDAVVDQHFTQRNRKPRLLACLADHPTTFGLGIDEGTAVVVEGRRIEVMGDAKVTVCLPPSSHRPARDFELKSGEMADLVTLRRCVRERNEAPWLSVDGKSACVNNGSLILGGGGRLPQKVIERFIELAGGVQSLIVVLPTASELPSPNGSAERRMFERYGARNIQVLSGRTVEEIESEVFLETVRKASGIWFGGGRQWRFVDAYQGTRAVEAFHELLKRGGVIGGSSAGASIQADYMVRGSPLGNTEMMCEGYERGFAFLPGTAVDQHFSQRKRFPDMESFTKTYPQFLGIGIDEGTALLVRGSQAEVLGDNSVYFFDAKAMERDGGKPIQVRSGHAFDLVRRTNSN